MTVLQKIPHVFKKASENQTIHYFGAPDDATWPETRSVKAVTSVSSSLTPLTEVQRSVWAAGD